MNLDHDRHAEARRREPGTEAAIARYYRDVLLGRALPPDDHLAAWFASLEWDGADARRHRPATSGSVGPPPPRPGAGRGGPPLPPAGSGRAAPGPRGGPPPLPRRREARPAAPSARNRA